MERIRFRFHGGLNDFLPAEKRGLEFEHTFLLPLPVKDAIEATGVPHPEIDLVLVNGAAAPFSHAVRDGDRVAAYPADCLPEPAPASLVRPPALARPAFVLDGHLGTLARYLRLLGFDAAWRRDPADEDLARQSAGEDRILLTRDRGVLMRAAVVRGRWVRATEPRAQLAEVAAVYDLARTAAPFSRCMKCNSLLRGATPEEAAAAPSGIRERQRDFNFCPSCRRLYWAGSHYRRMNAMLADLLQ
jgi:uncharacterized protein with PIN domain